MHWSTDICRYGTHAGAVRSKLQSRRNLASDTWMDRRSLVHLLRRGFCSRGSQTTRKRIRRKLLGNPTVLVTERAESRCVRQYKQHRSNDRRCEWDRVSEGRRVQFSDAVPIRSTWTGQPGNSVCYPTNPIWMGPGHPWLHVPFRTFAESWFRSRRPRESPND